MGNLLSQVAVWEKVPKTRESLEGRPIININELAGCEIIIKRGTKRLSKLYRSSREKVLGKYGLGYIECENNGREKRHVNVGGGQSKKERTDQIR